MQFLYIISLQTFVAVISSSILCWLDILPTNLNSVWGYFNLNCVMSVLNIAGIIKTEIVWEIWQ
jgi:hypothetical protein